ncbi:hypothetical protein GS597_09850 [Synechococcales cyanobacterium C]|uniref:Uncharacterized protein n=1 Tax=Petrachloros mirabilis ULC683 TaxID=2781853 RepID=A0A8K1ZZH7_9CYAN|nr:hypothetical protein [Petrachloros mirabilis]NCJ06806.1 hypothetical protein [Petrachloros mirabilis ULC683]
MASSDNVTLAQAYRAFQGDQQCDIPFIVWVLENPDSPLPVPGRIYLREHDYLHILLNRGISPEDEAFVVGFTLGNDPRATDRFLRFFKFLARHFYPEPYRFQPGHLSIFDAGVQLGRQMKIKGLCSWDFSPHLDQPLSSLRAKIGIYWEDHPKMLASEKPWDPAKHCAA